LNAAQATDVQAWFRACAFCKHASAYDNPIVAERWVFCTKYLFSMSKHNTTCFEFTAKESTHEKI